MPAIDPDKVYTVAEAAEAVGLHRDSVYRLAKAGAIRHRRIGPRHGRIEFEGRWLTAFLASCESGPAPEPKAPREPAPRAPRRPARPKPAAPGSDWRERLAAARRP